MAKNRKNIFVEWGSWHFVEAPKFLFSVWRDYFSFVANYFSITLLIKTFFAPWRRYSWRYPKGFNIGEFFSTLISNAFSRLLGAIMRVVLIASGIVAQIFVLIAGIIVFTFWYLVPFLIIVGFGYILIY